MSAVGRIVNTFVEPKAAFADIAARPSWLVPMALLVAITVVYMFAFSSRVGWERFMRQQIESSPKTQNLPAEERERLIVMQAKYAGPFGTAMAVIATPVSMLVTAGMLMFIFTTVLGGAVKFRQALGVTSYASLPHLVATGAAMLVLYVKDPSDFDLGNPAGFNIGFYLDPHAVPAWLVSLGTSIDVFSLWVILLLATGMSAATRKPWKTSLLGVAAPWAVFVLLKVAWAAIRG
jgi:hypothetical protein